MVRGKDANGCETCGCVKGSGFNAMPGPVIIGSGSGSGFNAMPGPVIIGSGSGSGFNAMPGPVIIDNKKTSSSEKTQANNFLELMKAKCDPPACELECVAPMVR